MMQTLALLLLIGVAGLQAAEAQDRRQPQTQLVDRSSSARDAIAKTGGLDAATRPAVRDPNRVARVAVLQAGTEHSKDGNPGCEANFNLLAGLACEAAHDKPDLVVFPEYAVSGWPYPPEAVINGLAESIPGEGPWYSRYKALAQETRTAILGWLVETDHGRLYNCTFLIDPNGRFVGKYRKVQANLGEQTWWGWSQGESFRPIEYAGVKYGISICADMWFPETVRCEELLGADVIVHVSIADDMGHIVPTRAFDSEIPIVLAIFNGGSYAVDSRGKLMSKLPAESPGWRVFALRPFQVRTDRKYGGLWVPKLGQKNLRNVDAYRILIDPNTRPPWTDVFLDNEGKPQTREQLLKRFKGRYDARDPAARQKKQTTREPSSEK
jgi:predicted amidohydrolase